MVPLEIFGEPMRTLATLTPHAWAIEGLRDVALRGASLTDVRPDARRPCPLRGRAPGARHVGLPAGDRAVGSRRDRRTHDRLTRACPAQPAARQRSGSVQELGELVACRKDVDLLAVIVVVEIRSHRIDAVGVMRAVMPVEPELPGARAQDEVVGVFGQIPGIADKHPRFDRRSGLPPQCPSPDARR